MESNVIQKYLEGLQALPPTGAGCHPRLLAVANYGVRAGLDDQQIFGDLRSVVDSKNGKRFVANREINDAVRKARNDYGETGRNVAAERSLSRQAPLCFDAKRVIERLVEHSANIDIATVWEQSPIRLLGHPLDDALLLLQTLYQPSDLLFIGDRYDRGVIGKTIRPVEQWCDYLCSSPCIPPHIIPNPVTGLPGPTKDNRSSRRADSCIASFRYAVLEFDGLDIETQLKFFVGARLPLVALIHSGNKSIHAWLEVNGVADAEQWEVHVERTLFERLLKPLGVDPSCKNEARLSRIPGHRRRDSKQLQALLWLSPFGRPI